MKISLDTGLKSGRNMLLKGICVFVTQDSESLNHVKVGDSVNLKYCTTDSSQPIGFFETESSHIAKDNYGRL